MLDVILAEGSGSCKSYSSDELPKGAALAIRSLSTHCTSHPSGTGYDTTWLRTAGPSALSNLVTSSDEPASSFLQLFHSSERSVSLFAEPKGRRPGCGGPSAKFKCLLPQEFA